MNVSIKFSDGHTQHVAASMDYISCLCRARGWSVREWATWLAAKHGWLYNARERVERSVSGVTLDGWPR